MKITRTKSGCLSVIFTLILFWMISVSIVYISQALGIHLGYLLYPIIVWGGSALVSALIVIAIKRGFKPNARVKALGITALIAFILALLFIFVNTIINNNAPDIINTIDSEMKTCTDKQDRKLAKCNQDCLVKEGEDQQTIRQYGLSIGYSLQEVNTLIEQTKSTRLDKCYVFCDNQYIDDVLTCF